MSSLLSGIARVAAIVSLASPALAGQSAAAASDFCFTPDIAAHCKRFLLLEGNMAFRQSGSPAGIYSDGSAYGARLNGSLSWGLGAMQNVSAGAAVGAAVAYGFNGGDGSRTTVELHAIRWLPDGIALEGSAGYMQLSDYGGIARGATSGIALTYRDLVGVTANLQTTGQQSAVLIGVRTGGWVTPIATAALVGAAWLALANAHWD
ncbi:MAG TPA: hypothetical protein VH277_14285 [Gemmatimonadaceae bacterium]|nr:hypothetical protein [Gemmatimonadaceae bacterium]